MPTLIGFVRLLICRQLVDCSRYGLSSLAFVDTRPSILVSRSQSCMQNFAPIFKCWSNFLKSFKLMIGSSGPSKNMNCGILPFSINSFIRVSDGLLWKVMYFDCGVVSYATIASEYSCLSISHVCSSWFPPLCNIAVDICSVDPPPFHVPISNIMLFLVLDRLSDTA